MADTEMASFRMPADLVAALRKHADDSGETLSDVLRRAALMLLGTCPTCGQKAPAAAGDEGTEPG